MEWRISFVKGREYKTAVVSTEFRSTLIELMAFHRVLQIQLATRKYILIIHLKRMGGQSDLLYLRSNLHSRSNLGKVPDSLKVRTLYKMS